MKFDETLVRSTAREVYEAMTRISREDPRCPFPRTWWPAGCCEHAACAVAAVLEDRGLQDWYLVAGRHEDQLESHMWVERRIDDEIEFSIDLTLQQFPNLASSSFVDYGPSPARAWFNKIISVDKVWDWKFLGTETQVFQRTIAGVRAVLSEADRGGIH